LPISHIKKYLVQKLDLASEAEVNWFSLFVKSITFMNQYIAIFLEANC